jgi:hypothetical protein
MTLRIISFVFAAFLAVNLLSGCSAISAHHRSFVKQYVRQTSPAPSDDPISGEWNVTFYVHEDKTPATFTFKLDGATLTGSAYSEHTGPGTIRDGKWADGKLSFALDFKKHQSINVTGELKDGKLAGQFTTEGFTDKWEAVKK